MKASKLRLPKDEMTTSWDLVQPSAKLVVEQYLAVLYLFLLPGLVYLLGTLLLGSTDHIHHLNDFTHRQFLGLAVLGVGVIWSLINLAPSMLFRLAVSKSKPLTIGEYYRRGLPLLPRLLLLDIVVGLTIIGGFILLIVPGVIFFRRYYLASYYLLDQKLGIKEAMQRSSHDTKPVRGYIWGIIGVQVIFGLFASFTTVIPTIGIVIGELVGYVCLFLPVLRYREVLAASRFIVD